MEDWSYSDSEVEAIGARWTRWWAEQIGAAVDSTSQFTLTGDDYRLAPGLSLERIAGMAPNNLYSVPLTQETSSGEQLPSLVWLSGRSVVGRRVLELGTGCGLLAKRLAPVTSRVLGIDASLLAIRIASGGATQATRFAHVSDQQVLSDLAGTFESGFAQTVFQFLNFRNALWLLTLAHKMLSKGAEFGADFHYSTSPDEQSPYERQHPDSCVATYLYTKEDLARLAQEAGFRLEDHNVFPGIARQFVTLTRT